MTSESKSPKPADPTKHKKATAQGAKAKVTAPQHRDSKGTPIDPSDAQRSARSRKKSAYQIAEELSGVAAGEFQLKTSALSGGRANLGCFLHEIWVDKHALLSAPKFVEKHTRSVRETRFGPKFQATLVPRDILVGPRIYRIVPADGHSTIFMEFIQGGSFLKLLKTDRRASSIQALARTLSAIAVYKGELMETTFTNNIYLPLGELAANANTPPALRKKLVALHEALPDKISELVKRLPRVACHNDVFFANMFVCDLPGGGQAVRLIDWGSCGRNMIGAEVHHFISASQKEPDLLQVADQLILGLAKALQEAGIHTSPEEVRLGAHCFAWIRALMRLRTLDDIEKTPRAEEQAQRICAAGQKLGELLAA